MSLLRLLAAGKSLVGMRESGTPYRLTSQRLLPQFGSGKNPFSNQQKMETEPTEQPKPGNSAEDGSLVETRNNPVDGCVREAAPLANQESSTPRQEANIQQRNALPSRRPAFLGRWKTKLVELIAKRPGKVTRPAMASPRPMRAPVQSELALDRIRVVRNDLSDADVEVVSARMSKATSKPVTNEADGTSKASGRATARAVGAGKS
jgi:hypothetical protein